ncbi:acyl-CoA carboxylase epsilon subunit [Streptomyces sp. NPDC091268]|uniref:acyl-CoA carboxylase epsilon subunit n=1 Tax=Streptomyces sp. NPDC091268 TaxID=3365979 RepID=UPI0038119597
MTHPELTLASLRILQGAPTMEELAVLAVLLNARLQVPAPPEPEPVAPTPLRRHSTPHCASPRAWAS